jgi:hypothetical protein
MKIAIMSPWNILDGAAVHAELLGKEWTKLGHSLQVFAPKEEELFIQKNKDQQYVTRCYNVDRSYPYKWIDKEASLDSRPLLENNYDVLVVENLWVLPIKPLMKIWPAISKKSKTILVIHEGWPFLTPEFFTLASKFDKITCFDKRYKKQILGKRVPSSKISIIPYPSILFEKENKNTARNKLNLPLDKKIVFTYGMEIRQHFPILPTLEKLSKQFPLEFIIASPGQNQELLDLEKKISKKYNFIKIIKGTLSDKEIYDYLHAADGLLLFKYNHKLAIPSTVNICLSSGCPIFISAGAYTEGVEKIIVKYSDFEELEKKLISLFKGKKPNQKNIDNFLQKTNITKIADEYIKLFKGISK